MSKRMTLLLLATAALGLPLARGVILFGTGDPAANTTPPTGALAGTGWQSQTERIPGATAIGPVAFLTAAHLATPVGGELQFDGLTYWVQRKADAPGSDLRLLEIAGRLDSNRVAGIFTGDDEVGRGLVLHGFGQQRGSEVFLDGPAGPELRGWHWGTTGGRLRWGTNVVTRVSDDAATGHFLHAEFSGDAGADEATVSFGDSGGGIFVQNARGEWNLAGVTYDVEKFFAVTAGIDRFVASLFDRRGYFSQHDDGTWEEIPLTADPAGITWQATRVSRYQDWIREQTALPPATDWPRLQSALSPTGPFTEHSAYAVDPKRRLVTFKSGGEQLYFHLGDNTHIDSIKTGGGIVELTY